jgi:hypothetical protein
VSLFEVVDNDQLVWSYHNHDYDYYSVKSEYNLLMKLIGIGEVLTPPEICPLCEQCSEDWHILLDCHDSKLAIQNAIFESIFVAQVQNFITVKEILKRICRYKDIN